MPELLTVVPPLVLGSTQAPLAGGVVPELAAREHLKNLPTVTASALSQAGLSSRDLDAVAATLGPGLPQALLVGARAAQAFAFALQRPFLGVHHHEAHLYSPWIEGDPLVARFESATALHFAEIKGGFRATPDGLRINRAVALR